MLSGGLTETVWLWFDFSMLLLSEGASDEAVGCCAPSFSAKDPAMLKWSGLLMRLGGGHQPHFSEEFFSRLDQEILVVDDYGYAGIDFRNDPNLVLLEGYDWDAALGKKKYA